MGKLSLRGMATCLLSDKAAAGHGAPSARVPRVLYSMWLPRCLSFRSVFCARLSYRSRWHEARLQLTSREEEVGLGTWSHCPQRDCSPLAACRQDPEKTRGFSLPSSTSGSARKLMGECTVAVPWGHCSRSREVTLLSLCHTVRGHTCHLGSQRWPLSLMGPPPTQGPACSLCVKF